tara:strand:+ start:3532 stop:4407 length:876 start_codon:yes stop_codon:yes gene_type:complete
MSKITKCNKTIARLDIPYKKLKDWEHWVLLSSDQHWDAIECDRKLLKKHLEEAKEKNADVLIFGDFFDVMGGKYDPRRRKGDIRPELNVDNYMDELTNQASEWLLPYAKNIKFISRGNHEVSVLKNQEVDLVDRLVTLLNYKGGKETNIVTGTYRGYVLCKFDTGKSGGRHKYTIGYTHGYGGGGPVTKGTIQASRKQIYMADADIIVQGHIHEAWTMEIVRERIGPPPSHTPRLEVCTHIQLPTYKEDYGDGDNWHTHTGKPPKSVGAYWLRFNYDHDTQRIHYQVVRAN